MNRQRLLTAAAVLVALVAGFFLKDPVLSLLRKPPPPPPAGALPDTTIVRPLTGDLRVLAPAGVIGEDYWVYVNDRLVSAPPRTASTSIRPEAVMHMGEGPDYVFLDQKGERLMATEGDTVTYLRDDMKDDGALFETVTLPISPGTYEVALMTRANRGDAFPFSITRTRAQVIAGQTAGVMLAVPNNTIMGPQAAAAHAAWACTPQLAASLQDQQRRYFADPLTHALLELDQALANNPPQQPTVIVDLPANLGGAREYNAGQIDQMIASLEERYALRLDDGFRTSCRASLGGGFDNLAAFADDFDRRIAGLRDITRKLKEAESASGGR